MSLKERHIEENINQVKKVISGMDTDKTGNSKRELVAEANENALFADGLDEAIIGFDSNNFCAVYDYDKCQKILVKKDGMSFTEAHEYMEFNVVSAYVGDFTPQFVHVV